MAIQPSSDPFAAHRFNPLDIPTHLIERFEESPRSDFLHSQCQRKRASMGCIYVGNSSISEKPHEGAVSEEDLQNMPERSAEGKI